MSNEHATIEQARDILNQKPLPIKNLEAFNPKHVPEEIKCRGQEQRQLLSSISRFVEMGGAEQVHLVGDNSTGKTLLLRWIKKALDELTPNEEVRYAYTNANQKESWQDLLEDIATQLEINGIKKGTSQGKAIQRILGKMHSDSSNIIVVDEFDKIPEASRSKLIKSFTQPQEVVSQETPSIQFIIATNAREAVHEIDMGEDHTTHSSRWNPEDIKFDTYTQEELEHIFRQRFEEAFEDTDAYSDNLVKHVAKRVDEQLEGDIRPGLKALKNAVDYARRHGQDLQEEFINYAVKALIKEQATSMLKQFNNSVTQKILYSLTQLEDSKKPTRKAIHNQYEDTFGSPSKVQNALKPNTVRYHLRKLKKQGVITQQNVKANQYIYLLEKPLNKNIVQEVILENGLKADGLQQIQEKKKEKVKPEVEKKMEKLLGNDSDYQ